LEGLHRRWHECACEPQIAPADVLRHCGIAGQKDPLFREGSEEWIRANFFISPLRFDKQTLLASFTKGKQRTMRTEIDVEAVRSTARSSVDRAKSDPDFLQQLKDDPERVLVESGLHERAIVDFMAEQGLEPEVRGYRGWDDDPGCNDFTCWIT